MNESDPISPADLLRNLRELVAIDQDFGVQVLPRSPTAQANQAPPPRPTPATPAATAPAATAAPAASEAPLPALDLPHDGDATSGLATIAQAIAGCQRCGLCQGRRNTVPGEGNASPELAFIGEGPGADEDRQGRPFVGAAGQLLDRMIQAMGLQREEVFIGNVIKCRPPGNRTPEADEAAACLPYLEAQLDLLRPTVICTLGNTPLKAMRGPSTPGITRQRGQPFQWRGFTVLPTFHPSYLLRNEAAKKPAWEDLKEVLRLLDRPVPGR